MTNAHDTSRPADQRDTAEAVRRYCAASGWVDRTWLDRPGAISFLAAGEYNQNWRVETPQGPRVFRINHGSQLGLGAEQVCYEHAVLSLLQGSGVTPVPLAVDAAPQRLEPALPGGVLLMEFLPGIALDYRRDASEAATIFAAVHACPVPAAHGCIVQADPVGDIVRESTGLLARFADHPRRDVQARLLRYRDEVAVLGEATRALFADEALVIVNTEVNSGNFLIERNPQDGTCVSRALVDWEKAVVSCRHQDLGHFLARTTTLWKTDYTFDAEARARFLRDYVQAAERRGMALDPDTLDEATRVLERTILLRGLSWCYMAWYEYTRAEQRALQNRDTFATIERYLDNLEWLLR